MKHLAYYDRGKEQPTSVTLDSETGNGRRAGMGSKNRFKLGLFGRQLLLRPHRDDSAGALVGELARLRQTGADGDRAGIEFMLPIGGWSRRAVRRPAFLLRRRRPRGARRS